MPGNRMTANSHRLAIKSSLPTFNHYESPHAVKMEAMNANVRHQIVKLLPLDPIPAARLDFDTILDVTIFGLDPSPTARRKNDDDDDDDDDDAVAVFGGLLAVVVKSSSGVEKDDTV